ncbi:Rho guanine nucleotide exchange factor 7 [Varanus komodoensis]|nr:Rho guanine nucleotide exchange factor 7 [Varanus komodoensis]
MEHHYNSDFSSRKESAPQVLLPEEEKIIVEETKSNGQTVIEEKSLVDTVYALKDEVQELRQDNKKMKKSLEEEQRARKELEKLVRKVLKKLSFKLDGAVQSPSLTLQLEKRNANFLRYGFAEYMKAFIGLIVIIMVIFSLFMLQR